MTERYVLASEVEKETKAIGTELGVAIAQWAVRQELREDQPALATVVMRVARERLRALLSSAVELPERGRITGRDVHREWRDGMLAQGRGVAIERMEWDTLSLQDRALDERIAAALAHPVPDDKLREAQRLLVRVLDLAGEGPLGGASYLNVPRTLLDDIHAALRKEARDE